MVGEHLISVNVRGVEQVAAAIARMERILANPRPMLLEIGEDLAASTKRRFDSGTAPDGEKWKPNSAVTMARWMDVKGVRNKKGDLNKKGEARLAGKKPLVGKSKMLSHTITYALAGNTLKVGSPMEYASTHQFGAAMGSFGRYYQLSRLKYDKSDFRRHAGSKKGHPIPWGNIPARPFLGVSTEDEQSILATARRYLLIP